MTATMAGRITVKFVEFFKNVIKHCQANNLTYGKISHLTIIQLIQSLSNPSIKCTPLLTQSQLG